jgi:hypothetical protein
VYKQFLLLLKLTRPKGKLTRYAELLNILPLRLSEIQVSLDVVLLEDFVVEKRIFKVMVAPSTGGLSEF